MIDYFALLDQPRAPWLDLDELKEHYHQKTLLLHPDAQSNQPSGEANVMFANLNEAYQVLQDPKRRLLHLLTLAGAAPSSTNQIIPQQLPCITTGAVPVAVETRLSPSIFSSFPVRAVTKPEIGPRWPAPSTALTR